MYIESIWNQKKHKIFLILLYGLFSILVKFKSSNLTR